MKKSNMRQEKVVIVTGAGRGLGCAEARFIAAHGFTVLVNDVDRDVAAETVKLIESDGGQAVSVAGDVSDWDFAEYLIQRGTELGSLDGLIANAGITLDRMSFNLEEAAWDEMIRVNLKGHFAPLRWAASHWRARTKAGGPGGAVVTTSSRAGLYGAPGMSGYSATKAGIVGLTLALSRELGNYGVRANVVVPRANTRLMQQMVASRDGLAPEERDRLAPERVAPVVGYLVSEASKSVTGNVFLVEGSSVKVMRPWQAGPERVTDPGDGPFDIAERLDEVISKGIGDFDLYEGLETKST